MRLLRSALLLIFLFFLTSSISTIQVAPRIINKPLERSDVKGSTSQLRVLHAAREYARTQNLFISLSINSEIVLSNISYGSLSPITSVPSDSAVVAIVNHTNPLSVQFKSNEIYTLVFYEPTTPQDLLPFEISPHWAFSTELHDGIVIGVINHSAFASPDSPEGEKTTGLPLDWDVLRLIHLIPPRLPTPSKTSTALLYRADDCVGCNPCVYVEDLSVGIVPKSDMLDYYFEKDRLYKPLHATQITIFKQLVKRDFTLRLGTISPEASALPGENQLLLFPCDFSTGSPQQRFILDMQNLGPAVHFPKSQAEHRVTTLFFIPPSPQLQPSLNANNGEFTALVSDEHLSHSIVLTSHDSHGQWILLPLIFIILIIFFAAVFITVGTRAYQRHIIDQELDLTLEESNPDISLNGSSSTPHLHKHHTPLQSPSSPIPTSTSSGMRLGSLDVFRGLVICAMVFCNTGAGGYEAFEHAVWNGYQFPADLIFPAFVWIMGVSSTLSTRNYSNRGHVSKGKQIKDILVRTIKLFLIGLFLANVGKFKTFRIFGILQRFAIAYLFISLLNFLPIRPLISSKSLASRINSSSTPNQSTRPQSFSLRESRQYLLSGAFDDDGPLPAHHPQLYSPDTSTQTEPIQLTIHQYYTRHTTLYKLLAAPLRFVRQEFTMYLWQWLVVLLVTVLWASIFLFVPAPNCPAGYSGPGGPFVLNGAFSNIEMAANSVLNSSSTTTNHANLCTGGISGYIDHLFLGKHMYQTPTSQSVFRSAAYDPEGLLGVLMCMVCAFFGVVMGRVLQITKAGTTVTLPISITSNGNSPNDAVSSSEKIIRLIHLRRVMTWALWGLIFFVLTLLFARNGYPFGLGWDYHSNQTNQFTDTDHSKFYTFPLFPINKNLWTIPFVTFSTFLCTLSLTAVYFLVDFITIQSTYHSKPLWSLTTPLEAVGKNSLMLFILPNVLATKFPFAWVVYGNPTHFEMTLMSFNAVIWVIIIALYCQHHKIFWKV